MQSTEVTVIFVVEFDVVHITTGLVECKDASTLKQFVIENVL